MKKILISLSIFALLILSTVTFAQTKPDPNIYDENGFRLDQKIPANLQISTSTPNPATTTPPQRPPQKAPLGTYKDGEQASCFDYYTFGSIGVDLQTDTSNYTPGDPVLIQGEIKNHNKFPITNLTIRARFVKDTPNSEYLRSEIMTLEDIDIVKNISLNAGESFIVKYSHLLPLNAPKGDYQVFFYAYNNDRFNQSGLSFTNDIVASRLNFTVGGTKQNHVYLDQTQITLNNQIHNVMAFMTQHEMNTPINISIPLVNPTAYDEEMAVTYKLYKWDGLREENFVDTKTETITVPANSTKQLTYTANNTDTSVYFLNIIADNKTLKKDKSVYDIQTQSNIRFVVNGYDFPRINSFGVDTYPIKANQETTLFTCFHNGASQDTINPVNISTVLYDDKGKEIAKTEYEGKIGGAITAIVKKFTSKKDLVNYKTVTTLTDKDGKVIDKIESEYKCSEFDPTLCPQPKDYSIAWMILGAIVLMAIIFMIRKMKTNTSVPTVMFILTILILPMSVGVHKGEAAVVTAPFDLKAEFYYNYPGYIAACSIINCLYLSDGAAVFSGSFSKTFNFIKGAVNLSNTSTNIVNIGENFTATSSPTAGYWFLTGDLNDSPPMDGVIYRPHTYCYHKTVGKVTTVVCEGNVVGENNVTYVGDVVLKSIDEDDIQISVSLPLEKAQTVIQSSNPSVVSCTNTGCSAVSAGTATITVSFPDTQLTSPYGNISFVERVVSYETNRWDLTVNHLNNNAFYNFDNTGFGFANVRMYNSTNWGNPAVDYRSVSYSLPPITYTITVPPAANVPQVSSCSGITNITNNGATINWTYSDVNNDLQDAYQIQIATDAAFTNIVQATTTTPNTALSNVRSVVMTGLNANTKYYSQVRTHNATNGWSTYASCGGGGFTTLCSDGTTPINGSCVPLSLACQASTGVTIPVGSSSAGPGSVSVSASGGVGSYTYNWTGNNTSGSGSSASFASIAASTNTGTTDSWSIPITFSVTDSATPTHNTKSVSCSIPVTDLNKVIPPSVDPIITSFFFNSSIVPKGQQCPLYLTVSGVNQCELHNRLGTLSAGPFNGPNINILGTQTAPIGTHTLWCKVTATSTLEQLGTRASCFSNADVKEN